ncbi:MAG: DHH family phosphoesterase, partial [Clostridia bacterium]|nr:DHH family phosphoesterase [Clostridia bacterium]
MSERLKRKWRINQRATDEDTILNISSGLGCSYVLASLLVNRGYNDIESAESFLKKSQEILHNPFLLNDMDKAVDRIISAVKSNEKITIYGDYDVDGVTSVSILYLYLEKMGANVDYYIPCRKGEGYGVSIDALTKLKDKGTNLIITVDTGVTAIEESKYAKESGIDFLVTDHHECTDNLPEAIAVINPKRHDSTYPFSNLAGVGVVFKLLCALESAYNSISILEAAKNIAIGYSDLTAIGTIAD